MANRSSILPIELIKFNVYKEDLKYLRNKYGINRYNSETQTRVGYGPAMREIIHVAVQILREKERVRLNKEIQFTFKQEPEYALNPTE